VRCSARSRWPTRGEPQRHMDQFDNRVDETLVLLRTAAIEQGMAVSGDGRVGECNAAQLLGLEVETLQKRRGEGKAPPSYRVPIGGSRVSYRRWRAHPALKDELGFRCFITSTLKKLGIVDEPVQQHGGRYKQYGGVV
jgi:hypothetical protein